MKGEGLSDKNEERGEQAPLVAVSELSGANVLDEEVLGQADLVELKFNWWQSKDNQEGGDNKLIHLLVYYPDAGSKVFVNLADRDFPEKIQELGLPEKVRKINPRWVSMHLMYSGSQVEAVAGNDQYDSVKTTEPLPAKEDFFKTVCANIQRAKEMFDEDVLLENVEFVPQKYSHGLLRFIADPDFIKRVLEETDSGMVLDLEHAYVAARNMGMKYSDYLKALPLERVKEIHLSRPTAMRRSQALVEDWGKHPSKRDIEQDVLVDAHKPLVSEKGKFTKRAEVLLASLWNKLSALEVITVELNLPKDEMQKNIKMVKEIIKNIKEKNRK